MTVLMVIRIGIKPTTESKNKVIMKSLLSSRLDSTVFPSVTPISYSLLFGTIGEKGQLSTKHIATEMEKNRLSLMLLCYSASEKKNITGLPVAME